MLENLNALYDYRKGRVKQKSTNFRRLEILKINKQCKVESNKCWLQVSTDVLSLPGETHWSPTEFRIRPS